MSRAGGCGGWVVLGWGSLIFKFLQCSQSVQYLYNMRPTLAPTAIDPYLETLFRGPRYYAEDAPVSTAKRIEELVVGLLKEENRSILGTKGPNASRVAKTMSVWLRPQSRNPVTPTIR